MKQLLTILCFFCLLAVNAQDKEKKETLQEREQRYNEEANPFKKFGYTPKIITLSKGKYKEFFTDTIVQIGSFTYNRLTKQITGIEIIENKRISEATARPDLVSRWMSPDPLSDEFPEWSPYNFVNDNPIRYVDPTGLAPEDIILKGSSEGISKVLENINSGLGGEYASVDKNGKLSMNLSEEQRENLSGEQNAFLSVLEEGINANGDIKIGVVDGDERIFLGSFSASIIDIQDINAFGDGEAINQNSILGHEVKEQFEKQIGGEKRPAAHKAGEQAESSITGYTRLADTQDKPLQRETVRRRERIGTRTFTTKTGSTNFNFRKGKQNKTVTVKRVRNNVVKVNRN